MTETEKKLLRQQAEAYAFIHDLRRTAVLIGDVRYIRLTEGIDARVAKRQQEYPTLFKRYFNDALKKAEESRAKASEPKLNPVKENGKRESVSQREEKSQEKVSSNLKEGTKGRVETVGEARPPRRKKRLPRAGSGAAKRNPE